MASLEKQSGVETVSGGVSGIWGYIRGALGKVFRYVDEKLMGGGGSAGADKMEETGNAADAVADSFSGKYKDWQLEADKSGYKISCLGADGKEQYCTVKNKSDGNPNIVVEPAKALAVPTAATYVDAGGATITPDQKIGRIVCDGGPKIVLSSPAAPQFELKDDGSLKIGEDTWHLVSLLKRDPSMIKNYDAYFSKTKPEKVNVREPDELPLAKPEFFAEAA